MNLADIYSYIDSKKRAVGGLLADPGGTVDKYVSQFREDNKARLNLMDNAYPMAGDRTVLNSPHQLDQFRKQLADEGANMAMSAATVWHGSPHKFDKFDSSKIGTGEGAQAYGHGLYLAESPDVAKGYQDKVKDNGKITDINAELSRLAKIMSGDEISYGKYRSDVGRQAKQQYEAMMDARGGVLSDPGSLYKVDLPDEHIAKMLDWDKPLSQQNADIQELFNKNTPTYEDPFLASLRQMGIDAKPDPVVGQSIYEKLGVWNKLDQVGVSDLLRKNGIPGIRYLDGGSRSAGTGSRNFVVFPGNEGLLSILERNGQPIK